MINAQEIQGQWNKIKGQVKEKWGQLSDSDLHIEGGNIDQLIGRIQQKTGEGRETIERYLSDLTSRGASSMNQAAEAARSYMGTASSRLNQGYDQMSQWAREGYGSAEGLVEHRPGSSVAAAFGLGLVVGLVVGVSLRSR